MHALVLERYRRDLRLQEVAEPHVGRNDVLVRVDAAALNQLDERIRLGEFRRILPYRLPLTLGLDVAGTVLRVGADVRGLAPGDEVYASPPQDRIGAFAERIAIDASLVAPRPRSISMTEAAALPLVTLTAWQALVERANVQRGQKVLVHAGAGGVGTMAIQLAKHLGAGVATTVSARDMSFVRDLGADVVVDHRTQAFEEVLDGYDVVIDSLGAANVARSLRVLRPGGRAIGISGPPDVAFARANGLGPLLRLAVAGLSRTVQQQARRRGVTYEFLFMRTDGDQLRRIAALVDDGVLRPFVGRTVRFDEIATELQRLPSNHVRGKVVADLAR